MELTDLHKQILLAAYGRDVEREDIDLDEWADANDISREQMWRAYDDLEEAGWMQSRTLGGSAEITGPGVLKCEELGLVPPERQAEDRRIRTLIVDAVARLREEHGRWALISWGEIQSKVACDEKQFDFNAAMLIDTGYLKYGEAAACVDITAFGLEAVRDWRKREGLLQRLEAAEKFPPDQRTPELLSIFQEIAQKEEWTPVQRTEKALFLQRYGQYYYVEGEWTDVPVERDRMRQFSREVRQQPADRGILLSMGGYTEEAKRYAAQRSLGRPILLLKAEDLYNLLETPADLDSLVQSKMDTLVQVHSASAERVRKDSTTMQNLGFPLDPDEVEVEPNKVFVAHPFRDFTVDDFRATLDRVLADCGLKPIYADEVIKSGHILAKICRQIQTTRFGIYDITNWNPNVTLELGLAFGLRQPTLLLLDTRHSQSVPSDLSGFDRIEYNSMQKLEAELKNKLPDFLAGLQG
jgi:predicted nucleotide-binding protein